MSIEALPLFPGFPGGIELAVIVLIIILLFGANKLPKLARSSGQAMGEFQKGREQIEQELEDMRDSPTDELDADTETEPEIGADTEDEDEPEIGTETDTDTSTDTEPQ